MGGAARVGLPNTAHGSSVSASVSVPSMAPYRIGIGRRLVELGEGAAALVQRRAIPSATTLSQHQSLQDDKH